MWLSCGHVVCVRSISQVWLQIAFSFWKCSNGTVLACCPTEYAQGVLVQWLLQWTVIVVKDGRLLSKSLSTMMHDTYADISWRAWHTFDLAGSVLPCKGVFLLVVVLVRVGLTGMHKTGCSGETRLVLHVPSSSWAGKRFNNYYYYYYCKSRSRPYLRSSLLQAKEEGWQQERTHHFCRCSRRWHCKGRASRGGGVSERLTQILPPKRQDALWSTAVRTSWHWQDTSRSALFFSMAKV